MHKVKLFFSRSIGLVIPPRAEAGCTLVAGPTRGGMLCDAQRLGIGRGVLIGVVLLAPIPTLPPDIMSRVDQRLQARAW